jgi:hypothetical protein
MTHKTTYLKPPEQGCLLRTEQEPTMICHQLVICQKECLTAFFVRYIVVVILFVVHLLLVILRDQLIHDADIPGPCPGKFIPLFVEMILIPAKVVMIITQGFELPHVSSAQQLAASFSNAPPIMAGHLKLMVSSNNAANDCPQKILSQDKAQHLAII